MVRGLLPALAVPWLLALPLTQVLADDDSGNNLTNDTNDTIPDTVAEMAGLVNLMTFHDTFLTAEPDGSVVNTRTESDEWEKFRVVKNHDGTVSFLSFFGKFLTAEEDGSVKCDRHHVDDWEKWNYVYYNETGVHTLESYHGKYLSAKQDGTVRADWHEEAPWRTPDANGLPWPLGNDGGWESFELFNDKENLVAMLTHHHKYVIAKDDGTMRADSHAKDTWEHFRLIPNQDDTFSFQTVHGNYMTFEPNGHVRATGKQLDSWEKFTFVTDGVADGYVKIKGPHEKYLSAKHDGSLRADYHDDAHWHSDGGWETFKIEKKWLALGPDMREAVREVEERGMHLALFMGAASLALVTIVMGVRRLHCRPREPLQAELILAQGEESFGSSDGEA